MDALSDLRVCVRATGWGNCSWVSVLIAHSGKVTAERLTGKLWAGPVYLSCGTVTLSSGVAATTGPTPVTLKPTQKPLETRTLVGNLTHHG